MEIKVEQKPKFIEEIETQTQKLWDDFVNLNHKIENSMSSINKNTNDLMGIFKETTDQWVNEIIAGMKKMTLIMNQCEIITKEFKQIEQLAKQTYFSRLTKHIKREYLKVMLEASVKLLENSQLKKP